MPDPQVVVVGRWRGTDLEKGLARSSKSISTWANRAKKAAAVGLAVAGAAAVKFGIDSVQAASAAQQSIGATQTVYGKYAKQVVRDSNRAANAVGLSANAYRESANLIGSLMGNQGVATDQLAGKSKQLIGVAADLAATFGGTTKEAVDALASAMRGEFEMVERYGISIKQVDVNARLAAKGQDKLTGNSKRLALQQALTAEIMSQSARAQGQFARESDTLAGQQQRLAARFENLQAKVGKLLLPVLTDLTSWASREGIPALQRLVDWVKDNEDEIGRFAGTVRDTALPPLKLFGGLARDLAGFLGDLPGPLQSIAIQAGLAAVVFPKLNSAMSVVSSQTQGLVGNLRNAEKRTQMLGSAARNTAGVAGLVALSEAAQTSNKEVSLLLSVVGGAGAGAVAGPWGVLAGAAAGLAGWLVTTGDSADQAAEAMKLAKPPATDYATALDKVSGAATRSANQLAALALQESGALEQGRALGLSSRDLTKYVLGNEDAIRRVNTALALAEAPLANAIEKNVPFTEAQRKAANTADTLRRALGAEADALAESTRKSRELMIATGELQGRLKNLKGASKIVARIESRGWPETTRDVAKLTRGMKLTPKQIQTVIKATGVDTTSKAVQRVIRNMREVEKTPGKPAKWLKDLSSALTEGEGRAGKGARGIIEGLEKGPKQARADLGGYRASISQGITQARSTASVGGASVGNALETGVISGFSGTQARLSAAAAAAVRAAITAARNEARAASPSRKTYELGRDLGLGLEKGLVERQDAAKRRGRDLVGALLAGVVDGTGGVEKALDRITQLIEKRIKLKDSKKEAAREKAALRALKDEYAAIVKNGKAQDALNRKLDAAVERLKAAVQARKDYAAAVRASVVEFGNITTLGRLEDGTVSSSLLIDQLKDRVVAAQRYADLIRRLSGRLNRTALQQLIDAGVEGGLATAEALISGGDAAIAEANRLQAQLDRIGSQLGNQTAGLFHDAGIKAAAGLVRGLTAESRALDRAARRLAKKLAQAVREELGIKSPSRVFRGIGDNVMKGLELSLSETRAQRIGTEVASGVVRGFAAPQLAATLAPGASSSGQKLEVELKLSPQQMSQLESGRTVTARGTAFVSSGGRKLAVS